MLIVLESTFFRVQHVTRSGEIDVIRFWIRQKLRDIFEYFMVGYFVNTFIVETSCKHLYKVYTCNFTGLFIAQT